MAALAWHACVRVRWVHYSHGETNVARSISRVTMHLSRVSRFPITFRVMSRFPITFRVMSRFPITFRVMSAITSREREIAASDSIYFCTQNSEVLLCTVINRPKSRIWASFRHFLKIHYRTCTGVRSVSHFTSSSLISLPLPLKRLTKITCL